jgi:divalent metal cation (Fe/Co/Zn/Cd) transporter
VTRPAGGRLGASGHPQPPTLELARSRDLRRRGLGLEYATLGWNVIEVGFVAAAAVMARSVALAGFALDSCIEIGASLVVVGQLRGDADSEHERRALRRIGLAFLTLACYLAVQTAVTLVLHVRPGHSFLGIAWLTATAAVMFALAAGKARTGAELGNPVLSAEARITLIDAVLAMSVLAGLVCNAVLGWWWADVLAGVVVIAYGLREGVHHLSQARR